MKFVILDNTAWTTHFVVLQSTSRAAETASGASRRTTERLVCWTPPTSSLLPFIPIRSSGRFRRHVARAVTNFFRSALTEIPVRRMREHDAPPVHASFDARFTRHATRHDRHSCPSPVTFLPSRKRRRPHVAGVVRHQMGIDARRARIRRFPNRPRRR